MTGRERPSGHSHEIGKEASSVGRLDVKLFKTIADEVERKALERLYSVVIEHGGKVEWAQLPPELRVYLKSKGYSEITVDENFIAKILHEPREGKYSKNIILSQTRDKEAGGCPSESELGQRLKLNGTNRGQLQLPETDRSKPNSSGTSLERLSYVNKLLSQLSHDLLKELKSELKREYKLFRPASADIIFLFIDKYNAQMTREQMLKLLTEKGVDYETARKCVREETNKADKGQSLIFVPRPTTFGTVYYQIDEAALAGLCDYIEAFVAEKLRQQKVEEYEKEEKDDYILQFVDFIMDYAKVKEGKTIFVYREKIEEMLTVVPKESLEVDWTHLNAYNSELAHALLEDPDYFIPIADDALRYVLKEYFFINDPPKFHVRFYNVPTLILPRQLLPEHINRLISVEAVITKLSETEPYVSKAVFVCKDCGEEMVRIQKPTAPLIKPSKCPQCGSKNIELDIDKSTFLAFQSLAFQDPPEKLRGGKFPRQVTAYLLEDLIDSALPGDRVILTGILRVFSVKRDSSPILRKVFEVHHVLKKTGDIEDIEITKEDEQKILEEAKRPDLVERWVKSFAPTVYGYEKEKLGFILSLFGGEDVISPTGELIRKRIHVLNVGDPGTAKTHLMDFASKIAPRAVRASGKGVSGVGLTAAATRDEITGKWTVEAGTLVLADLGFAIIDELDKMSTHDRNALHEPMEQGRIDFSKAGINLTINARATVIAAANPKLGKFNLWKPLREQIDLPQPLWSRFDLIFLYIDEPDWQRDYEIGSIITKRWYYPEEVEPPYTPEFMKKYIAYARKKIKKLKLSPELRELIPKFYADLRQKGKSDKTDGISRTPITPRQFEAILRLAEAHARMHLRDTVTIEDFNVAKELIEYSLSKVAVDEEGNIDISILEVGRSSKEIARMDTILDIIRRLQEFTDYGAPEDDIIDEARRHGITKDEAKKILAELKASYKIYEPRDGYYKINTE